MVPVAKRRSLALTIAAVGEGTDVVACTPSVEPQMAQLPSAGAST
jgi:hypothetical protein